MRNKPIGYAEAMITHDDTDQREKKFAELYQAMLGAEAREIAPFGGEILAGLHDHFVSELCDHAIADQSEGKSAELYRAILGAEAREIREIAPFGGGDIGRAA